MSEKKPIEKHYSALFESEVPEDLVLMALLLTIGIASIYLPILDDSPVRYVLTILVLFFIPGYCLISALFPKVGDISVFERLALSIGLSVAVVILLGLGLNYTPWGIRLEPIIIFITMFTLVTLLIAHYQRLLLPNDEKFRIQPFGIAASIREEMVPPEENGIDRFT